MRTTNPIESSFATARLGHWVTKGPRRRAVNAPHLVALVRAGATFEKGVLVERPDDPNQKAMARLDDGAVLRICHHVLMGVCIPYRKA